MTKATKTQMIVVLIVTAACAGTDKTTQAECDQIEQQIKTQAFKDGRDPTGICTAPPTKGYADACAAFTNCRNNCCK